MFDAFYLNRHQREKNKALTIKKIDEVQKLLFEELDEVQKIIYRTPEKIDCSAIRKANPELELYCNAIQLLEWYYRYLSKCPHEMDLPTPIMN